MDKPGKTTREYIVRTLIEVLESCPIKRVIRGKRAGIQKEFLALPETDFPLVVLDCGLPQPEIKYSSRQQGVIDEVLSRMNIEIFVYLRVADGLCGHEDTEVSGLLGSIWKAICNHPNIGKVMKVAPSFPSPKIVYESSYCYFTVNVEVVYCHTKDTI